jgi:antitoxin (DNA-binding transcriptional repressor) of toxin-antitoxin stability system
VWIVDFTTDVARAGKPVAELVGLKPGRARRRLGLLDGKFKIPADFNRPLPASLLRDFEGRR